MSVNIKMTEDGKFVDFCAGWLISKEWLDQYVEQYVNITTVSDEAPRFVVSTHEYLNESQRKQIEKEFNEFHPTAKLLILDGGKVLTQIAKGV